VTHNACFPAGVLVKLHHVESRISNNLLKCKQFSRKTCITCRRLKTTLGYIMLNFDRKVSFQVVQAVYINSAKKQTIY